ncbi:hypothetical protein CMI37_11480 [Candidatus Pacearchaeota archaeon]|nr:hypothetical protein [Candidatus Pacearchaeota archaeon]|tara:strand:- start:5228 stop:5593 length:366 start_codon:yes stop_codon:yes gene_type:complete
MDVSDQKVKGKYCFAVIDDCSRYCLGVFEINRATTAVITKLLDKLVEKHGKPRGIKHIRTAIHSPTTTGKIERFFQTLEKELPFYNNDLDFFRLRYNHFRPHISLEKKCPADVYFDFIHLF